MLGITVWILTFALPVAVTDINAPSSGFLGGFDSTQYQHGLASANYWTLAISNALDHLPPQPIYVQWEICNLFYLYAAQPITCLPRAAKADFLAGICAALDIHGTIVLALNTFRLMPDDLPGMDPALVVDYPDTGIANYAPSLWLLSKKS